MNERVKHTPFGFSLIELLIVVAVIGILAAIIIPTYKSSIRKANEASAVTTVNAIKVAQAKYVIDHNGQYGTFDQLVKAGFLDKRFNADTPRNKGYMFVMTLVDRPEKAATSFKLNANPELAEGVGATGEVFYYSEPDAGIFYNRDGPASSDDDIL